MKNILLITVLFLTLGGCGSANNNIGNNLAGQNSSENDLSKPAAKNYSLAEIAKHDKKGDCWMAIHGKVYDVSEFNNHPGGEAILAGCGKDATVLFETRPMGSNTPHSQKAREMLVKYYIGDLQ